jgi:hypothetical protein
MTAPALLISGALKGVGMDWPHVFAREINLMRFCSR